jgi:ZIP family zinc transporter
MDIFVFALILSLLAGLSTTVGCIISFFVMKEYNPSLLSVIMGFSAGVMILVSFLELLQEGINSMGLMLGIMFFFIGMLIMLLIDVTISHQYEFEDTIKILKNPELTQEIMVERNNSKRKGRRPRYRFHPHNGKENISLERTSILVFLGVFIHNLPEGIATFVGTVRDVELGILLAIAVALHNIPEGVAVAVPIYAVTKSKKKAFFWSFLSGISEFLGAVVFGFIFLPFINDYLLGAMLAIVGGLMVYISLDELLPVSHSLGKEHHSILGLMLGMLAMSVSIVILT